jgi:DNA-binding protein Fis
MRKTSGSSPTPAGVSDRLVECWFITLRGLEYLHAQRVLEMCGGNRAKAAKMLGIERTTLRRYLRRAGLR